MLSNQVDALQKLLLVKDYILVGHVSEFFFVINVCVSYIFLSTFRFVFYFN